ncbi:MAG: hypothetical protein ACR2KK_19120 [Acidimicrobiales bacterium]
MNALVFLGIAVVLSLVGCLVLWLRSRQPGSMDAHIRDFARELDALAPGSPLDKARRPPVGPREQGAGPERPERPVPRHDPPGPEWPADRRGPERPFEGTGGRPSG